ncbi:phage tail protein [Pasteurellaceae bacterium HPA106]|uniref:phage tail protein n=1 Tax=Spirabiliibacterium pneumoniae TaxID=221400 RepID=UPI001AADAF8E|nr:phage tail protein [Spirabiliibacterium pneumoniae]MBE2895564.1 phage tail protein [Spirabiliibacterium pneumoniae]
MKITLPFWMKRGELHKIAQLFERWWQFALNTIKHPLGFLNEENCPLAILNLIAYQRDIQRFKNEPERLYRLRVKYAFINALDAGSTAGFKRIFERLGIGYMELEERFDRENWDVIKIRLNDSQIARNQELLMLIIRQYGRTCRRYTYEVIINNKVILRYGEFNHDYQAFHLKLEQE